MVTPFYPAKLWSRPAILLASLGMCSVICLAGIARADVPAAKPDDVKKMEAALPDKAPAEPKAKRTVLVFGNAQGYVHSSIGLGEETIAKLGEKTGAYRAVINNDPAVFDDLKPYDAVVLVSTTGHFLLPKDLKDAEKEKSYRDAEKQREQNLLDFVQKDGKGLMGIHAASDAYYKDWPEYGELIGAFFDNHPWGHVTYKINDTNSPLTSMFKGEDFTIDDETYRFLEHSGRFDKQPYSREKVHELTSIDFEKSKLKESDSRTDRDNPISWIHEDGKGRVFYCSHGHGESVYWNPVMLQHYLAGLQFALGDLKADASLAAKPPELLKPEGTPGGSYGPVAPGEPSAIKFRKITLTRDFYSEGACVGDFNHDGHNDVASGPYWYEGPDFNPEKRHEIYTPKAYKADGEYSDNFLSWSCDVNGDGWDDIVVVGFPGAEAWWYENPKDPAAGHWAKHMALKSVDDESPAFADIVGDGKPALVCASGGYWGYARPDPKNPDQPWTFHKISPAIKGLAKFTHGLGVGDVNGDGKPDLIEATGWWEHPASLEGDPEWKFHPFNFSEGGGTSTMFAYDVNGDGRPDIITSLSAHGYGLAWFEQKPDGTFEKHKFAGKSPEESPYGVHFSQPHALALGDLTGSGLPALVTGKRHFAHHSHGDPEPTAPAVLYWFELVRKDGKAEFVPHLVDEDSGVGTQVTIGNVGPENKPGIVVGNKNGTFVFVQEAKAK